MERILIVGGVAGGATAAARAKRLRPDAQVALYEQGSSISYMAWGMPYILARRASLDSLIARTPEQLGHDQGIDVKMRHRAISLNLEDKTLQVQDLVGEETVVEPYDRLIIATGARAFVPPLPGREAEGVLNLRTLADGVALEEYLKRYTPRRVAIVGAGPIGLEMCEAFTALGMQVHLVEMAGQVMPQLEPELAAKAAAHLETKGVSLHVGTRVQEVAGEGGRVTGLITDAGEIPVDLVLLAMGIRPVSSLAEEAGLVLGTGGAIRVDEYMRTSHENVFAAGDCTTAVNLVSGKEVWMPLGSTSRKQGRVAGTNVAGGSEAFPGIAGTFILKCFDLTIGGTGLSEKAAVEAGFRTVVSTIEDRTTPKYIEGGGRARFHLVADADSGRLLGAQVVGDLASNADKRLDVFSTCIKARMTARDLESLDLAYAPPYSHAVDLPIVAGSLLVHKLDG